MCYLSHTFMVKVTQFIKWLIDLKAAFSGSRHSETFFKFSALNHHNSGPAVAVCLTNTICLRIMPFLYNQNKIN